MAFSRLIANKISNYILPNKLNDLRKRKIKMENKISNGKKDLENLKRRTN